MPKIYSCENQQFLSIFLSSRENIMSKISNENNFYVFRYAHVRYAKSLFSNIQKQ